MGTSSYLNTEWPIKIAQSLMHRYFATVCSRVMRFSPKCSMENLYHLVKHSLKNSWNSTDVMSDVTLHVNIIPLTVEDRLLIKTSQTEKGWIVGENDY